MYIMTTLLYIKSQVCPQRPGRQRSSGVGVAGLSWGKTTDILRRPSCRAGAVWKGCPLQWGTGESRSNPGGGGVGVGHAATLPYPPYERGSGAKQRMYHHVCAVGRELSGRDAMSVSFYSGTLLFCWRASGWPEPGSGNGCCPGRKLTQNNIHFTTPALPGGSFLEGLNWNTG